MEELRKRVTRSNAARSFILCGLMRGEMGRMKRVYKMVVGDGIGEVINAK